MSTRSRNYREVLDSLPEGRRERIQRKSEALTVRALRLYRGMSQTDVGTALGMTQSEVSKLERRGNLSVRTLRRYLGTLGARLRLVADFPDGTSIMIADLAEPDQDAGKTNK
jgi:transcriptional regulator with XRE-family HTH domain